MNLRSSVPLLITIVRLILGAAFYFVMKRPAPLLMVAGLIIAVAVLTDWLDGNLARRWNAVSTLGKFLDPIADAIFCMVVFIAFAQDGLVPAWIVVVLVAREVLVNMILRPLALKRKVVIAAKMPGKIKTVTQFVVMFMVLAHLHPAFAGIPGLWPATQFGFYVVLAMSLLSALPYLIDTLRAHKAIA